MESFWQVAVTMAGVGAIGAFFFWSLYKDWLSLPIFSKMTRKQTFILMMMFLVLTFLALVVTIVAYVEVERGNGPEPTVEPAQIEELELFIRRDRDDAAVESFRLVREGRLTDTDMPDPSGRGTISRFRVVSTRPRAGSSFGSTPAE